MVFDDSRTRNVWSIEDIRTTTPQLDNGGAINIMEYKRGGLGQVCPSLESSSCVVGICVEQRATMEIADRLKREPFTDRVFVHGGIQERGSNRVDPRNIVNIEHIIRGLYKRRVRDIQYNRQMRAPEESLIAANL
jgi:hypothetical protein